MDGNIYEIALRSKLRFASKRGSLTLEDLYSLTLEDLDAIAIKYNKDAKDADTEISFIGKKSTAAQRTAQVQFELVKHIIDEKLAERDAAHAAAEKAAQKQKILELLAGKKEAALASKTEEELMAMLAGL